MTIGVDGATQDNYHYWVLAFDFGGTKHTAALKRIPRGKPDWERIHQGGWQGFKRVYSPSGADSRYDIETMIHLGKGLQEQTDKTVSTTGRIDAIGVSFGGPVDAESGIVRLSHHVSGWQNTPLARILSEAFQAPTKVDNDANIAARGEYHSGAGRDCHSLMYITVSTGVGGGWFLKGQPWHGVDSMAGEIGHTVVDPQGPICLCGKRGCVERLASGPYMAQDACNHIQMAIEKLPPGAELAATDGGSILRLAGGDIEQINAEIISAAADQGDQLAVMLLERAARALGIGIGNAANLVNPQRFILGGGVTKAGHPFFANIRKAARATTLPEVQFEILPAELGDDAPLWGALALAVEAFLC